MTRPRKFYESIIYFLVIISLLSSFTNFVYVSAISTVTLVFIVFVFSGRTKRVGDITIRLFWFFFYCALSVLITNPRQLIDFGFYRYDGNLFITFAPLLILSMSEIKFNTKRILFWFVLISSIANIIGMALFFAHRQPEYPFFFTAHNAAGGFLAMLVVFTGYVIATTSGWKRLVFFLFILTNFLGLYLTNSRGSLLPLFGALLVMFLLRRWKNIDIWITVLLVGGIMLFSTYIASVRGTDVVVHYDEYYLPEVFYGSPISSLLSIFNRSWTMVNRLYYLWPKASYLFMESPIFGTGFGTFNDNSYNWVGIEHLIYLNVGNEYVNGANHAHNSYLHILSETGIVGFGMFVGLLLSMRKFILKMEDRKLSVALFLAFLYALFSGLFEHRITTPAQMIPFVLILGMEISNSRCRVVSKKTVVALIAAGVVPVRKGVAYEN